MKNTFTNKLTVTVLLASLAFLSLNASAGQDSNQRFIIGANAENGKNCTLRLFRITQRSKFPIFYLSILPPNIITS